MNSAVDSFCDDNGVWSLLPEPVLLKIFYKLSPQDILNAGQSCIRWNEIARDDYLWKRLFHRDFKVDKNVGLRPGNSFIFVFLFNYTYRNIACNESQIIFLCLFKE